MKTSSFWKLVAFLAAVCAVVAAVAYYLKKKESEAEDYDDMLFNEDYLADYMPKDDECCCEDDEYCEDDCCCDDECCCEEQPAEACQQSADIYTEE